MAYSHRQTTIPSHIRPSSGLAHPSSSTQASQLQTRINEKKLELENLRQLRDLSAGLAAQMQQLEEKLGTLSSGTEAVAAVLSNWHNVLRAIHMASAKTLTPKDDGTDEETPLPQTLVRIPIQHAEAMQ
ncbi:hypothetical protein M433DRAFT_36411, partial [Acidomyces richmondensis BFW]